MGNVTVFVVFLIFIIAYVVLGSIKVKDKGEITKVQIPVPEFDFEEKAKEKESAKDIGSAEHKKRMIENFENRFSKGRSDITKKHFPKEKRQIMKEQIYNIQPESNTHKISNSYMEDFSLKKAVIYSEILKRKF